MRTSKQTAEMRPEQWQEQSPHNFEGFFVPEDHPIREDRGIPSRLIKGVARVAGANVKYTLEIPEEITDGVPIGIAHGYGGVQDAYAAFRNSIARNGKPAYTYSPPRNQHWWVGLGPDHLTHPDKLLSQAAWVVTKQIMACKEPGIESDYVDLVGHSMGGPTSTTLAERKPDHIRSITYLASAGLDGHSIAEMVRNRLPRFGTSEGARTVLNREIILHEVEELEFVLQALGYWVKNPYRALAEGLIVGNVNIQDRVRNISAKDTKTGVIGCKYDHLISAEKSIENTEDYVDATRILPFGHLAPQRHPVETGSAVLDFIDIYKDSAKQTARRLQAV